MLVAHNLDRGEGARFVRFRQDGRQEGQGRGHGLPSGTCRAAKGRLLAVDVDDLNHVRNLRNAESLRTFRTGLSRVAVDRLSSAEDEIELARLFDRLREDIARRQDVASGDGAVADENRAIGAAIQSFAKNFRRLRGAHRNHGHRTAKAIFDFKSRFQRVQILGI